MPPSSFSLPNFQIRLAWLLCRGSSVARRWLPALLLAALSLPLLPAAARAQGLAGLAGPVVITPHVRAELVAQAPEGVLPGRPLALGLWIRHQPHWHTYWKNPGDSGLPTSFAWTLPPGFEAGEIEWPVPKKLPIGPLVNLGYDGEVLLPVTVTVPAGFAAPTLDVELHAEWLVCKELCVPESGTFRLRVPAQAATVAQATLFDAARVARPLPRPGVTASARLDGQALAVEVSGLPAGWRGQAPDLLVENPGVVDPAGRVVARWQGDVLTLRAPLAPQRFDSPAAMQAVLALPSSLHGAPPGGERAVAVRFDVAGAWPPLPKATGEGTAGAGAPAVAGAGGATGPAGSGMTDASGAPDSTPASSTSRNVAMASGAPDGPGDPAPAGQPDRPKGLATGAAPSASGGDGLSSAPAASPTIALLFAFAGGLLLNLMPCVFPVLSLKVLGFAHHAGERRTLVGAGLAYTAGVVASFVALAGLLLALRAGGEQLGWGFQLQSPPVVAALAVLFTVVGLNLSGVFEWAGVLPGNLAAARARHPLADHALTGVLAVAVASPCTAPFMGAALGAALVQPAAGALALFATLGLGMAAPYLAASLWPGLASRLPRPGAWMARLRAALAFPMFATVVWLVWVLGQQTGIDGAAALLGVLLAVAFAAWTAGQRSLRRGGRVAFGVLAAGVLAAALAWAWPAWHEAPAAVAAAPSSSSPPAGERWQPWSPQAVADAQRAGRMVFVDFTAAWCVTCQFNKRTTLADARVLADFDARRVLLLRADWTRRDDAITRALAALGRSGVPVYAVYPPGGGAPRLLSELLGVDEVRQALAAP